MIIERFFMLSFPSIRKYLILENVPTELVNILGTLTFQVYKVINR